MNPTHTGRSRIHVPALLLLLAALVASLALAWGGAAPAAATERPPCIPRMTKIGGKRALVNCGPATATLTVGGHTYHYRHGLCQDSKSSPVRVSLTLGTLVTGTKDNGGEPYLAFLIPTTKIEGSVFTAFDGGKELLGDSLISYTTNPLKGSFKGEHTEVPFKGTWNCHGKIWHAP